MTYLLDTNAVVALLRDRPAAVRERFRKAAAASDDILVSAVVVFELWYGVARSKRRHENAERVKTFLSGALTVLPFDDEDAQTAGVLRAAMEAEGNAIGPCDLLIAAQALRNGLRLVTANASEFSRVEGLTWEDWSAS